MILFPPLLPPVRRKHTYKKKLVPRIFTLFLHSKIIVSWQFFLKSLFSPLRQEKKNKIIIIILRGKKIVSRQSSPVQNITGGLKKKKKKKTSNTDDSFVYRRPLRKRTSLAVNVCSPSLKKKISIKLIIGEGKVRRR